jgi:hypothetical protein
MLQLLFLLQNRELHQQYLLLKLTGAVAGVYVGAEYGVERIRGRRDWVRLL